MAKVDVMSVQMHFNDMLRQTQEGPIQISKDGKTVAVLMSYETYQALETLKIKDQTPPFDEAYIQYAIHMNPDIPESFIRKEIHMREESITDYNFSWIIDSFNKQKEIGT